MRGGCLLKVSEAREVLTNGKYRAHHTRMHAFRAPNRAPNQLRHARSLLALADLFVINRPHTPGEVLTQRMRGPGRDLDASLWCNSSSRVSLHTSTHVVRGT